MTRSGRSNRADQLNRDDRAIWKAENGDGDENADFEDYRYFNPTSKQAEKLLSSLTPKKIDNGEATKIFPRRVRLSDSAMGVVVYIGVTINKSRDYWPLNFNGSGYPIAEPRLCHLGHPFIIKGAMGQIGKDESTMYILSGLTKIDGYEIVTVTRPRSRPRAALSEAGTNSSDHQAREASQPPAHTHRAPEVGDHSASKGEAPLAPVPLQRLTPAARKAWLDLARTPKRQKTNSDAQRSPTLEELTGPFTKEPVIQQDSKGHFYIDEEGNRRIILLPNPGQTLEVASTNTANKHGLLDLSDDSPTPKSAFSFARHGAPSLQEDSQGYFFRNREGDRRPVRWNPGPSSPLEDLRERDTLNTTTLGTAQPLPTDLGAPQSTPWSGAPKYDFQEDLHTYTSGPFAGATTYSPDVEALLMQHGYKTKTTDTQVRPVQDQSIMSASNAPGRAIAGLSPTPPPKGKSAATMDDLVHDLQETTRALNEAVQGHTRAVSTAERLDAITLTQSEDLRAATKLIRQLLAKNPRLSDEERKQIAQDYQGIKSSFGRCAAVRDGLRGRIADDADSERIFEHETNLDTPNSTTQWAADAAEALQTEDVQGWYARQDWKRQV